MSKPSLQSPPGHRFSFFVFSRLILQPDGAFLARPCGIYRAETLDQALAEATMAARAKVPVLLRLEQTIKPYD